MQQPTHDLFGDPVPEPQPAAQAKGLAAVKISAKDARSLSPTQRSFNKLISRIHNLGEDLKNLDAMLQKHQAPHQRAWSDGVERIEDLYQAMALQLDTHLQTLKLSKAQKRDLTDIVRHLLMQMEHRESTELARLRNTYFDDEEQEAWAQDEADSMQRMRELAEEHLDAEVIAQVQDDPDALLHLVMKKIAQDEAAQIPPNRAAKRKTPRQQKAQQQALDAKATLRHVFRQLASLLHPDREPDPQERERKTALMSQANAAYERQDLASLLKLQIEATVSDPEAMARMSEDKLKSMIVLLKQQVASLEQELREGEQRASMLLRMPMMAKMSDATVRKRLKEQLDELNATAKALQADVAYVRDPNQLKNWIKEQRAMAKQHARLDAMIEDWFD